MRPHAHPWFSNPTPQAQCVAALQGHDPLVFMRWLEVWARFAGKESRLTADEQRLCGFEPRMTA